MRIAQIAPLWELVPPQTYGGTELVVYNLTEELVRRGHEVTLFAAGGSTTSAHLQPCAPMPLRAMEERFKMDKTHCTVMGYELKCLEEAFSHLDDFDIIHNHMGFQALPFAHLVHAPCHVPTVTTLHNALDPEVVREVFAANAQLPYISISNYQQQLWPELNYVSTIYHGIQMKRFKPSFEHRGKDYLVFLGRLSPEKGPHLAVRIAKMLGLKLILAGKIDQVDQVFYDQHVAPMVDGQQIQYIGEVDHFQKVELLRHAMATLCPVLWPEPFGLVMIESMACGTPVFALRDGSVPEVVDHGKTGYVSDSVEGLVEALKHWREYDRRLVRSIAEKRFSAERMVDDHLCVYTQLVEQGSSMVEEPLTPTQVAELKWHAEQPKQTHAKPSPAFEFNVLENGRSVHRLDDLPLKEHYRGFYRL